MSAVRRQRGYLYLQRGLWMLRYCDNQTQSDGSVRRVQKAHRLARAAGEYKTKGAARGLAAEFLAPLNEGRGSPQITSTLADFVDAAYLPFIAAQKRASTFYGYRNLWKLYLAERSHITLRDFTTADGERLLAAVAFERPLSTTTLRHIKAFLSGAFRYAKRQGVMHSENPMRDVVIPKAKAAGETFAYSLPQILEMLELLSEPAATIVAAAAFTGARRGELRGFCWEDYSAGQIRISRSYWRQVVQDPKTAKSKASVPVISQLAERLERHRKNSGGNVSGLMFPAAAAETSKSFRETLVIPKPINLDVLARDVIAPTLRAHGIAWHGWHAFRRGLATNLHQLGVQDKIIQRILRHSNVAVTQACYIKTDDADVLAAMHSLETAPKMHPSSQMSLLSEAVS